MRKIRWHVFLAAALQVGCATAALENSMDSVQPPRRRANVLTVEEIRERAPGARSALDAIRQLRNAWLRNERQTRSYEGGPVLRVYVDNVPQTPDWLENLSIDGFSELRFYPAREATQRWGTGHQLGAIEVVTARAAASSNLPADRPSPGAPTAEPPRESPAVVDIHHVRTVWSAHGNTAVITRPKELAQAWDPAPAMGVAFGIQTSPNASFYLGVDVNRFTFSPAGVLDYLASARVGALRSTDNVRVTGGNTVLFNVTANVRLDLIRGPLRPYVYGSIGYGRLDIGSFSVTGADGQPLPAGQFPRGEAEGGDQLENSFTLGGGGGAEWRLTGSLRVFLDVRYMTALRGPRYRDVYGKLQLFNTSYFPVRLGVLFP